MIRTADFPKSHFVCIICGCFFYKVVIRLFGILKHDLNDIWITSHVLNVLNLHIYPKSVEYQGKV